MARLNWTKASDAGLVHLKGLANLETLTLIGDVFGPNFTDAGLVHLKGSRIMERLSLSYTKGTDAFLCI